MKVLITGGTGFIATHLASNLLGAGHTVVSLRRKTTPGELVHPNLSCVRASFGDSEALDAVLPATDVVVHLGWSSVPHDKLEGLPVEVAADIQGSVSLFESCVKHGVAKVVFVSSGGTVYGFPRQIPIPEAHPTEPVSSYGIAKLTVEKYLQLFHRLRGLSYVILRISNAYGENQSIGKGQGVIGAWIDKIAKGERVEVWGDGGAVRDYVYISDTIGVISSAATESALDNGIFNLGSGQGHSLNDILAILKTLHPSFDVIYRPLRKVDVDINVLDTTRLRSKLDFRTKYSLDVGIKRTWEHARGPR